MWADFRILVTLALVGVAMGDNDTSISHYNINYNRQDEVTAVSTSSYDYWWPYPPGGVAVTTTTTTNPTTSELFQATTILLTNNIIPTTSLFSGSSSEASVIYITALPASSSSSLPPPPPKLNTVPRNGFKSIYLAPAFALFGLLLGSACAWFCYGFFSARRRHGGRIRVSELEVGPKYIPAAGDEDFEKETKQFWDAYETRPLEEGSSPSKRSVHGSVYTNPSTKGSSWLSRALSTRSSEKPFSWPAPTPYGYEREEADPFLSVPTPSRGPSTRSSQTGRSLFPTSSPDPLALLDEEDAEDEVDMSIPYASLRHSSIRRGILERLKFGTVRRDAPAPDSKGASLRRGHARAQSDICIDAVRIPERSHSPQKAHGVVDVDETQWVPGSGFRIVEEKLDAMRCELEVQKTVGNIDAVSDRLPSRSSSSRSSSSKDRVSLWSSDDKFTALPARRSPSKARPTFSRTSSSEYSEPRHASRLPRVDSSVLPLSPPQITSPPLESQLCFTPGPRDGASIGTNNWDGLVCTSTPKAAPGRPGRKSRKLHAPSPPCMPLPSTSDSSPYRNRLVKEISRTGASASQSDTRVRKGTETRHGVQNGALRKVDEIVSRSWSERGMGGASSPTMFGAR
jgi:hypothetical protein